MYQFHSITITGMDTQKTKQDPRSDLFNVFLNLSSTPPSSWAQDFDKAWIQNFYAEKRKAQVLGGHIMITCSLDDWHSVHLPELQKVVKEVNQRQEAEARDRAAELKRMEEEKAETQRKIEEAARRFKKTD